MNERERLEKEMAKLDYKIRQAAEARQKAQERFAELQEKRIALGRKLNDALQAEHEELKRQLA